MKARVIGLAAIFLAGCTSSTAPFASLGGIFTGAVVNGPNGCPVPLEKGMRSSAVVTVGQMEANVDVQFSGPAGSVLQVTFGSSSFSGTVSGNHVNANIVGTAATTRGGCVFTMNGVLTADLGGNTLSGDLVYTPQTNGNPECARMQVTGCITQQSFGVTRQ
jgi:hypothetical protein